jgi:protein-tyrosine-phosphatase
MHILFVCRANMCRSAIAEAICRKMAGERDLPEVITVASCGLNAEEGAEAIPEAVAAAAEFGGDLSNHQATPFMLGVVDRADYIVTMTRSQKREVLWRLPMLSARTFTLAEFVHEQTGRWPRWRDIADPTGGPREGYRKCACLLFNALTDVFDSFIGPLPPPRGFLARLFGR